jgi:hypothetical protein
MKKNILKIISIVTFFSAMAFALTYPYELSYNGTEDVRLIEESHEYTSLEQVINRPEFKGEVLFIRVGYVFESERIIPNNSKFENTHSFSEDGTPYIVHSVKDPYVYQINTLCEMNEKYKDKVKMIYLSLPPYYKSSQSNQDGLRKWKAFIKRYPVKGYHLRMSNELRKKLRDLKVSNNDKYIFPYNLIIDKKGKIIDTIAPSPIFEKQKLYRKLDSILNSKSDDNK